MLKRKVFPLNRLKDQWRLYEKENDTIRFGCRKVTLEIVVKMGRSRMRLEVKIPQLEIVLQKSC